MYVCKYDMMYVVVSQVMIGDDPVIQISYLKSYPDIMGKAAVWIDTFINETVIIDSRSHTYTHHFHVTHQYIRPYIHAHTNIHTYIYMHIRKYIDTYIYVYTHT